jgi:hypothetical protein
LGSPRNPARSLGALALRLGVVAILVVPSLGAIGVASAATTLATISRVALLPRADLSAAAWNSSTDTYDHDYVYPGSWSILLDGCGSQIDGVPIAGSSLPGASWLLEPVDRATPGTPIKFTGGPGSCRLEVQLPELGTWRITLEVGQTLTHPGLAHATKTVVFNDVLVVALGDSFASGEGNPGSDKRWIDAQCHRSATPWPARLARSLETDTTAVTFLNLACSGASLEHLTDVSYAGMAPEGQKPLKPQVRALRSMLGDPLKPGTRGVDLLLASVGINILPVSSTLVECAADLIPGVGPEECQRNFSHEFDRLPGLYDELELSLSANIRLLGQFHLIGYPGRIMTDAHDEYPKKITGFVCSLSPSCTTSATLCGAFAGMRVRDKQWITKTVETVNSKLIAAGKRHGWIVTPTIDLFRRHGYCSLPGTTWFRSVSESLLKQGNVSGTAHPNASGHKATYLAVAKKVKLDLSPGRAEPQPVRLVVRFKRLRFVSPTPNLRSNSIRSWDKPAFVGVMRGALNDCGSQGSALVTVAKSSAWVDVSKEPCMQYTIETQGRTFVVRASVRVVISPISVRPPGNPGRTTIYTAQAQQFHLRADGFDASIDPVGPATQPREVLTIARGDGGFFQVEYTITKESASPVVAP